MCPGLRRWEGTEAGGLGYKPVWWGDVGEDMEKVGWGVDIINNEGRGGGNAVMFMSGVGAIERAGVVLGVVRTVEEVLDDLVGGGNIELINVIKLKPRGGGKGRRGDGSGEGRRRQHLKSISFTEETVLVSRLTTLRQAVGNNKGLKVKVIDKQDGVGKSKGEDTESK